MKKNCLLSMFTLVMSALACAGEALPPAQTYELTVPNFDDESPACVLKIPTNSAQCTAEACILRAPAGSTLNSIELGFRCGPKSAPTGFENPSSGGKVQWFRAKNAPAELSLADGVFEPANERFRELIFCVYGKFNNFCGFAKVMRIGEKSKVDGTGTVKSFLQGIELRDPLTKDGR